MICAASAITAPTPDSTAGCSPSSSGSTPRATRVEHDGLHLIVGDTAHFGIVEQFRRLARVEVFDWPLRKA